MADMRSIIDRLRPVALKAKDIIVSAAKLGGALALTVFGLAVGVAAAMKVRLPDAVLLQMAKQADRMRAMPSASSERDFLLMMLGVGIAILIYGLHLVREWVRPFEQRTRAKSPPVAAE
jgi:hypothetical protein